MRERVVTEPNWAADATSGGSKRPSTVGYWVAVAIMVAGFIAGHLVAATTGLGAYDRLEDFPSAAVPGVIGVDVTETGDQLVYYLGDEQTSWRELGLQVSAPNGKRVAVTDYLTTVKAAFTVDNESLDWDLETWNDKRTVIATFEAETTGRYLVATTAAIEDGGEIAVGESLVRPVVTSLVIVAPSIGIVGLAAGLALVIVTRVRRSRTRTA